jgi:hypothetical protein
MWSPRLGISYDWTREGRAKLYAHWGRYHQWLPMAIADRALSGQTWHRMDFDPAQCGAVDPARGAPDPANCPGVRPPNTDAANTAARGESLVGAGTLVTPGLAGGYTDEAVLGVEYEALEDLLVGVAYIHRGLGRAVEDLSLDGGATRVLANPGAWSFEQEARLLHALSTTADPNARRQLATQLAHYRGARRFDPPRRDYDALQLTFRRRLHGSWFAQGSYTVSALRGDYPGLASADNGVHLPGASSQYDLVELAGNRRGPLPLDRRHNFKLDALYFRVIGRGVVGLTTRLRVISGAPIDALAAHPVYGQAESFLLPRGAIGRTDTDVGLDLRLSYTRAPTRRTRLEVFAEIFNALHRQTAIAVDERYTLDPVRPIIGGDRADLIWAKADAIGGAETGLPAQRNPDFQRPTERRLPLAIRLGAQLSF